MPDLKFLHQLDPEDLLKWIYNRYAYISVVLPYQPGEIAFDFKFGADDAYQLRLPPELPLLRRSGYRYVMFPRPWLSRTALYEFSFLEEIEPTQLYIYKRNVDSD